MILGRIGNTASDDFSVTDSSNDLVPGIDSTAFVVHLFDPSGTEVSSSITPTITELGFGHYRLSFIPNVVGIWMMVVYHTTHFPAGKSNTLQAFNNDFDTIATLVERVLGLTQENFYVDNTSYDGNNCLTASRIRTYTDEASVGTDSNVLASYNMTATYDGDGNMITYEVKKA